MMAVQPASVADVAWHHFDYGAGSPLRVLSSRLRGKKLRLRRELEAARNALDEMAAAARTTMESVPQAKPQNQARRRAGRV
jgi:hypothetical protein